MKKTISGSVFTEDKGGLEWQQQEPNTLYAKWSNKPTEVIRMGNNGFIGDMAKMNTALRVAIRKVSSKHLPIFTGTLPIPL